MNQYYSDMNMARTHLECRECKKEYEPTFKYICDECFGPLDVKYDFPVVNKNTFKDREKTYWRYFELLPIEDKSSNKETDCNSSNPLQIAFNIAPLPVGTIR